MKNDVTRSQAELLALAEPAIKLRDQRIARLQRLVQELQSKLRMQEMKGDESDVTART